MTIPETVTSIGEGVFVNCTNLGAVDLRAKIKTLPQAMFGDSGVRSVNLPDSLTTLDGRAFADSDLRYLTVPANVNKIMPYCFWGVSQ